MEVNASLVYDIIEGVELIEIDLLNRFVIATIFVHCDRAMNQTM